MSEPSQPPPPRFASPIPPAYPELFNRGLDTEGVVQVDMSCRKCSYNLRGLSIGGRCPECGTPVGLSVHGDLLRFSEPQWVRKLQRGINLILVGVGMIIVTVIIGAVLGGMRRLDLAEYVKLLSVAASIVMVVGGWFLTEPDPSGLGEDHYGTSRKIIRFALVVSVISSVLQFIQESGSITPDLRRILLVLSSLAGLIGLVGQFAQLNYLSKLALRIPDQQLADRARTIMWVFGIGYGVILIAGFLMAILGLNAAGGQPRGGVMVLGCGMAIAGVIVLIFAIRYLLLLERLGRRFGEQAALAEQTWANTAS